MRALHLRLTLAIALLLALLGFGLLLLIAQTSERYAAEVRQRLDAGIAMYVVRELPLLQNGRVNDAAWRELANRAMTVNPSAEVYLLDTQGNVVSSAVPPANILHAHIRLEPLQEFLRQPDRRPVYGDDPTGLTSERVFSVAPIEDQGTLQGYLYVVLGGQPERFIADRIRGSYAFRLAALVLAVVIAMTVVAAACLFFVLTRRLRTLDQAMFDWSRRLPAGAGCLRSGKISGDEISALADRFQAMSAAIEVQFRNLKTIDALRRELFANVSHDLRTPLASLRGYIETALVKTPNISNEELGAHLRVALRQADHLSGLIDALFELARLESGTVVAHLESVSIAELLQDVAMRFQLLAETARVKLTTQLDTRGVMVLADVALIERALGNLIENAMRHTPSGGQVQLVMIVAAELVEIKVVDSGSGIDAARIPRIFDRINSAHENADRKRAGLGLSIVKRILELHDQTVRIQSAPGVGTTVEFALRCAVPPLSVPLAATA